MKLITWPAHYTNQLLFYSGKFHQVYPLVSRLATSHNKKIRLKRPLPKYFFFFNYNMKRIVNNVQWEGKSPSNPQWVFKLKLCRKWIGRGFVGNKNGRIKRFCSKRQNIFHPSYFISEMQWKWRRLLSSKFQYRLLYWSCSKNIYVDRGRSSWRRLRASVKKAPKVIYPS